MLRPTISALELPPPDPASDFADEWETYRSRVGTWLAEGKEGQFVLLKGKDILGFWGDFEGALAKGYRRFPKGPFFVHHVLSREPVIRIGFNRLCRV